MDLEVLAQTREVVETIIDDGQSFSSRSGGSDNQVRRDNIEHCSFRHPGMTGDATSIGINASACNSPLESYSHRPVHVTNMESLDALALLSGC